MSNARYTPYGADDDPFLTHPAGPGLANRRRSAAPHWGADQPTHDDYGYQAPRQASYAPAPLTRPVAPHPAAPPEQAGYAPDPYFDRHNDPHALGQIAGPNAAFRTEPQQSGNFRPRARSYAPQQPSHPQFEPAARPHYGVQADYAGAEFDGFDPPNPMPQAAAQRSFSAPPRYAAPRGAAAPMGFDAAPAQQHAALQQGLGDPRGGFALPSVQAGQWMQWAGALCTVLAVAGAGNWGYQLAMRDAHGIPVVRAALGPLRLAPETPGGEVSAHQGLAVNAIPATGVSGPAPDQITLAPQTGDLAPEDTTLTEAGSFAASAMASPTTTSGEGQVAALAGASDQILAQPEAGGSALTDLADLPNSLPEDMPLTDAEAVERALEAALAEGGDALAEDTTQTEAALPPADAAPAETASMSNTDPVAPPTAELDPTSIPVGTPMVQFGAFDTAEIARAEWATLQTRFTELMADKALVVEQAKSGGRDFFRLRAHGFDSADDTRRFCAAILAENGTCLTVDQR